MSQFHEDELHAPSWMNTDFFEEVLRKCEKTDIIAVKDVKMSPATVKGDHYASVMFRAGVTYDSDKAKGLFISMIIKTMPQVEGDKLDLIGESYIFETESSMYENTIPKFEAELRKIGDKTVLGARMLYYSLKPRKIIVFEDICPLGYEVIRERQLKIEEARAAILKLAKWHAVSYKLAAEGDTSVTDYKETFFNMDHIETMPFMTSGMENLIEQVESMDELKSYGPKLHSVQKDLIKQCIRSSKSFREKSPLGVYVLCHGDFHRKNIMLKFNTERELEDVMLLDFQICYFGPAALDILYGMYMLVNGEIRKNNFEELVHFYATNFTETLKKLQFEGEIPKISDFYIDILRHRHFEVFLLSTLLPMMYAIENHIDFDKLMSLNEERKKMYSNPDYVAELKRILPMMLQKGYFE